MVSAIYKDNVKVGAFYDAAYNIVIDENHYTFIIQTQ